MKISAEFVDGNCKLVLRPEGEWEQKLLGAVAKNGAGLTASVQYKTDGHYSNGKCSAVSVTLISEAETQPK